MKHVDEKVAGVKAYGAVQALNRLTIDNDVALRLVAKMLKPRSELKSSRRFSDAVCRQRGSNPQAKEQGEGKEPSVDKKIADAGTATSQVKSALKARDSKRAHAK